MRYIKDFVSLQECRRYQGINKKIEPDPNDLMIRGQHSTLK